VFSKQVRQGKKIFYQFVILGDMTTLQEVDNIFFSRGHSYQKLNKTIGE